MYMMKCNYYEICYVYQKPKKYINKSINKYVFVYIYIYTIVNEYHSIHVCTPFFFIHIGTANNLYYSKYSKWKSSLINRTSLSPHIFSGQKTAANPGKHQSRSAAFSGLTYQTCMEILRILPPQTGNPGKNDSQNGMHFSRIECSPKRRVNFQRTEQWW